MTERRKQPPGEGNLMLVRRGLLGLTALTVLATAFELATVKHWHGLEQIIPWAALVLLAVATVLTLLPGGRGRVTARAMALLVLVASIYGVLDHIAVNYNSGPLDQRFADTWDSMPLIERSWYAVTKTVGPSPTLAPGVLGLGGTLMLLVSLIDTPPRENNPAERNP